MTRTDLESTIRDTLREIAPEADLAALDPQASFRDQFEMDSVDYLNFVLRLEERLGVHVPEEDYPKLSSLRGCSAYLESLVQAAAD